MPVSITKNGFADLTKRVNSLTSKQVYVGIPAEGAERKPEPGEKQPATNALIAYVHEFGVPERNIPARPFLRPGVASVRDRIVEEMRKGAKALVSTSAPDAVDKTMHIVGLVCQRACVQQIDNQNFVPLKPATLARRKAKGRQGEAILIDTGALRQAITYTVRDTRSK